MSKTPRIYLPSAVRKYVFERDKNQCQSCGKQYGETSLTIDHIIPLSRGGSNDISNLQTLCFSCNRKKSDKIDKLFRRKFD